MPTENYLIALVQSYSRCDGQDEHAGTKAHAYGSSHSLILTNELSVGGLPSESHAQFGGLISLRSH